MAVLFKRQVILAEFEKRESYNDHTGAVSLLVHNYGTEDEKDEISGIRDRINRKGYISDADDKRRKELHDKYWPILLPVRRGHIQGNNIQS